MLLSGDAIRRKALITNAVDAGYREASYDLHIGKIIGPDGNEHSSYDLPAQGIAKVISREETRLPKNIAGFAMVKTSLCNEGVLAINIGIVDPGYSNLLSSFLINFGKSTRTLREGDVFLRLSFFEYEQPENPPTSVPKSAATYVNEQKLTVVQNFSGTFLNLRDMVDRAGERAFSKYRKALLLWLPAFAFGLALLTFALNFGNLLLVQRWLQPNDVTKAELLRSEVDGQIRALTDSVKALQNELTALRSRIPTPAAQRRPPAPIAPKQ